MLHVLIAKCKCFTSLLVQNGLVLNNEEDVIAWSRNGSMDFVTASLDYEMLEALSPNCSW